MSAFQQIKTLVGTGTRWVCEIWAASSDIEDLQFRVHGKSHDFFIDTMMYLVGAGKATREVVGTVFELHASLTDEVATFRYITAKIKASTADIRARNESVDAAVESIRAMVPGSVPYVKYGFREAIRTLEGQKVSMYDIDESTIMNAVNLMVYNLVRESTVEDE